MMEPSIRDCLMKQTKDELTYTAIQLGLEPLRSSARKAEWVAYIENALPERPDCIRLQMRQEWIDAVTKLLENGGQGVSRGMEDNLREGLLVLERLGLSWQERGVWHVRPCVAEYLRMDRRQRADHRVCDLLSDIMEGWLLHVGMMPMDELLNRASELMPGSSEEEREETRELCFALLMARKGPGVAFPGPEEKLWVTGDDVDDPAALLERLQEPHIAALSYPEFDMAGLAFSARTSHVPGDPKLYDALAAFLQGKELKPVQVSEIMETMVYLAQNEDPDEALATVLEAVRPDNVRETEQVITLVTNTLNSIPRWANKGHSAAELAASQRPQKLPKMPGRNDPCTCGSGRKYKLCCGKRLN